MLFMVSAVEAQKISKPDLLESITKAEAALANPKKNTKAAAWIAAGDAYFNAQYEPVKPLYVSMESSMLTTVCGKAKSSKQVTIGDENYNELTYFFFKAYMSGGKVAAWRELAPISKGAMDKAMEYYNKAYEISPSDKDKVKAKIKNVVDYYKQLGDVSVTLGEYKIAADAFVKAYEAQSAPAYDDKDLVLLYYAGYMYTIQGSKSPAAYAMGEKYLTMALDGGYQKIEDENKEMEDKDRGNIYYYIYHCCTGSGNPNEAKLKKAKDALLTGISTYPLNERIFEGLTQLYTTKDGGLGNPDELLAVINRNLEANPNSVTTWFGRGRVYFALKDYDECIISFKKVTELSPKFFDGQFYLGLFYTLKGDDLNAELEGKNYTSQSEYDKDLVTVYNEYKEAVKCFEAAIEVKPKHEGTLEYLKSLCFRLRDEEGMMDKYTKYNTLYKEVSGK